MNKLYLLLLGLILTLRVQNVTAYQDNCCYPCDPCCGINVSVFADCLYWKVCRSDLDFDRSDNETGHIVPNYDSGWRIGGRIQKCEWDIGVRYTSYNTKTKLKLFPEEGGDHFAKFSADWDVVDIEVGYSLDFNCNKALLRPFVGAKLAWIDEHYNRLIFNQVDNEKVKFKGCGLYTGLEGCFELYRFSYCNTCIPLSLACRGSIAILDSHFDGEQSFGDFESELEREFFRDECLYVPVLEAFVGLDIGGAECWCVTPHVLLGYEVQSFGSWREFGHEDDIASLGIGGLVARLTLEY